MSKNTRDYQREHQAISRITTLRTKEQGARTLQKQGTQAIRLGVVEGYFVVDLPYPATENARFIEFEAPHPDIILIGSVVHSRYMAMVDRFGTYPADFDTVDESNELGSGEVITTWLPYSLATDDSAYTTPFALTDIPNVRLPDNRVRLGCKVNLTLGSWSTDNVVVVVMYQLRFTMGWN